MGARAPPHQSTAANYLKDTCPLGSPWTAYVYSIIDVRWMYRLDLLVKWQSSWFRKLTGMSFKGIVLYNVDLYCTAGLSRPWAPGPNLGPWPTFVGPFRFKIYALNLDLWALSQLMTTIGHKKFESVQLYRDSVLMYSTVCKSLHFRGSVTY